MRDDRSSSPDEGGRSHAPFELEALCVAAAERHGAAGPVAACLARATLEAEARGRSAVGISHFFDYIDALKAGRLDGHVPATVLHQAPGALVADCHEGLAQYAFEGCQERLLTAAQTNGVASLSLRNCFTTGELGFYVRHLAGEGYIALAASNTPPLLSFGGSRGPVLGTNPLAYALPSLDGIGTVLVDQASSAAAFVTVREHAARDEPLPDQWAIDADGEVTHDAHAALTGALLPFGGYKGGNIAFLVEVLATLSGAAWSLDANSFDKGAASPGVGLFLLAISPSAFGPGYSERLRAHLERVFASAPAARRLLDREPRTHIHVPESTFDRLQELAQG